jgi:hypothetical protein
MIMTIDELNDYMDGSEEPFLQPDGFEDCLVGIAEGFGGEEALVYDKDKVLQKLQDDGMSFEEAIEYFEYNIIGAYVGPKTPLYITLVTHGN